MHPQRFLRHVYGCACALLACNSAACSANGGASFDAVLPRGGQATSGGAGSGGDAASGSTNVGGAVAVAGGSGGAAAGNAGATTAGPAKPSAACSMQVVQPSDGDHELLVNSVTRGFIIHLPAAYPGSSPYPVVMAFHGKGDKAAGWDGYAFKLSELGGAENVLVYPQALPDPLLANEPSFERNADEDLVFVDALLGWLDQNVCFDASRVFVVGHSLGSTFAQTLACRRAGVIRASATQAGNIGETSNCAGPVAAWLGYGLDDSPGQVAACRARADFWLAQNGCDRAASRPGDPTPPCLTYSCASGAPVEVCEDPLGTHKWGAWMTPSLLQFFAGFPSRP